VITTNTEAREQGATAERELLIANIDYRLAQLQKIILATENNELANKWGFAITELYSLKQELEQCTSTYAARLVPTN
jgi:hypothetical protein